MNLFMRTSQLLLALSLGGTPERVRPFAGEGQRAADPGGRGWTARHEADRRLRGLHRAGPRRCRPSTCGRGSAGTWTRCCFEKGSTSRQGDVLFLIDPRTYQADYDRAVANLAQAQAHLTRMEANYKRAKNLIATQAISQADYDQAVGDRDEAEAAVKVAEAALHTADLNLEWTRVAGPHQRPHQPAEHRSGQHGHGRQHGPHHDGLPGPHVRLLRRRRGEHAAVPPLDGGRKGEIRPARGRRRCTSGWPTRTTSIRTRARSISSTTGSILPPAPCGCGGCSTTTSSSSPPACSCGSGCPSARRIRRSWPRSGPSAPTRARSSSTCSTTKNQVVYREVQIGAFENGLRVIESGLAPGERFIINGLQRVKPGDTVQPKLASLTSPGMPRARRKAIVTQDGKRPPVLAHDSPLPPR